MSVIPAGLPPLISIDLFGSVPPLPFSLKLERVERETVCLQVEKGINLAWTSSCGRLFDAVAALAGGCVRVDYEAQAAIEMEMVCKETQESYPYDSPVRGPVDRLGRTGMNCPARVSPLRSF